MLTETQKNLIDAAIKLFSTNDVNLLSVGQINELAGVSNKSALYYHFKTKIGLFEAALNHILEPYVEESLILLNDIDLKDISVRKIIRALLLPMINILLKKDGIHHIKFFSRMISAGEEGRKIFADGFKPLANKTTELLLIHYPESNKSAIELKVLFTFNIIINVVSDVGLEKYWELTERNPEKMTRYLADYIEGGISFNHISNY